MFTERVMFLYAIRCVVGLGLLGTSCNELVGFWRAHTKGAARFGDVMRGFDVRVASEPL